ncbi:MAG: hypothetical protein WD176_10045, partial [Pirellulales bacterium]
MQRNFTLFLILSFAILIGWVAIMDWFTPRGYLEVAVQADDTEGALLAARNETNQYELPLDKERHQLLPGTYDLSIEGNADKLRVDPPQVTIEQKETAKVSVLPRPQEKPKLADQKKPADKPAAKPDAEKVAKAPDNGQPQKVVPPKPATRQRRTLGSIDPASPYQMLVVLDSRGAVVERIELASPEYRDWEDRTGYL